jgi:serine protease inhibitor
MITLPLLTAAVMLAAAGMSPPALEPTDMPAIHPWQDPARAVEASNGFGIDLFKRIAAGQKGNVFLSPYSISIALTMAAEGAKAGTLHEMISTLHIREANAGSSLTPVHAGYAELARRFAAASGDASPATRQKIKDLRDQLDAANMQTEALEIGGNYTGAHKEHQRAEGIAKELNELLGTVDRYDLRVANALWVEKTFDLIPAYTMAIDSWYGTGAVAPMDFLKKPEAARNQINEWVEDHTEKRIKDLLPAGSITPDTRLVIANAVYFKGQWTEPFKEAATKEEDFRLAGGTTIKAKLMQDHWRGGVRYAAFNADGTAFETPHKVPKEEKDRPACYPDDGGFTMIELPYKGGELAMTIVLPRTVDGLAALEAKLSGDAVDGWVKRLEPRTVDTAMPRFKMEFEQELSRTLQAMGMKRAFVSPGTSNAAEFGGMSASSNPAEQLFIGLVQHKAWVEVTETGTEAAAATAVVMRAGSAMRPVEMVPFNPVFRADHPFVFLIRDTKSGVVLFMGRVVKPV